MGDKSRVHGAAKELNQGLVEANPAGSELGISRTPAPKLLGHKHCYWDCESIHVPYFKLVSLFGRERKLCITIRLHFSLFDLAVAESARNGRDEKVMAGEARRTRGYQ